MFFNRTLEQIKSTDPITQSLLNFRLQDLRPNLRSNQYFNVIYEHDAQGKQPNAEGRQPNEQGKQPNAQGKQVFESLKIETKGLSDPELTLLDKYVLLNPFDFSIVNYHSQNQQIQKSAQQQQVNANQQIQKSAQQQQITPTKGASCLSISLEFLYFVKKVTNTQLKNYYAKKTEIQTTFYHWIRDFLITQLKKTNGSQFQSINQSEIDAMLNILSIHPKMNSQNIENIQLHKYLEHTILNYIYQSHSISNIWTNEYETRWRQIKPVDAKVDKKLFRFSQILKVIDNKNNLSLETEICKVFELKGINLKKLDKASILEDNLSGKLSPSKRVINMVINNLHAFQYQDWHLTQQILRKTQLPSDPSSHPPITKYPHLSVQQIQSGLKSKIHGLINLKTQSSQVVFFHQLARPQKIFNDQTQMIQKIFEAIDQYHQLFTEMNDQQILDKFSLFPVKSDGLIWNPWQQQVQIDKLEVWKLLFNLQTNPVAIPHDLSTFTKTFPKQSAESRLCNFLDQIHYEFKTIPSQFQLSTLPQNTKKLSAKYEASCLQMIPFAKVLIVVYATYHKSIERFLYELKTMTKTSNEQDGLLELLQIINKKVKGTGKLEANGTKTQFDSQPSEQNNLEICIDQIVELIQKRTKITKK